MVETVEHRKVVVRFPDTDTVLTLAADSDAIHPLRFQPGSRAVLLANLEHVVVDDEAESGRIRLVDGREVDVVDLWPVKIGDSLAERLALGDVDPVEAFEHGVGFGGAAFAQFDHLTQVGEQRPDVDRPGIGRGHQPVIDEVPVVVEPVGHVAEVAEADAEFEGDQHS